VRDLSIPSATEIFSSTNFLTCSLNNFAASYKMEIPFQKWNYLMTRERVYPREEIENYKRDKKDVPHHKCDIKAVFL
jgi:hypothetical protein